jgi:hypothetical protein
VILKRGLIQIQDDRENGIKRRGLRPDATTLQNADVLTQEQIQEFLNGSRSIEFMGQNRGELYRFVQACWWLKSTPIRARRSAERFALTSAESPG